MWRRVFNLPVPTGWKPVATVSLAAQLPVIACKGDCSDNRSICCWWPLGPMSKMAKEGGPIIMSNEATDSIRVSAESEDEATLMKNERRTCPEGVADFWRPKKLEELAAEQGVKPIDNPQELMGPGSDLWADDAEFEEFLAWLRESRRTGG